VGNSDVGFFFLFFFIDVVASEMVPRILQHIRICLNSREVTTNTYMEVEKNCGSSFWQAITAAIKDSHAMQRWTEALLHQMTVTNINDVEAYWIIWTLFNTIFLNQASIRFISLSSSELQSYFILSLFSKASCFLV
jgi:telomere length regulation protein